MTDHKNILVYCETAGGALHSIVRQVVGCGRRLADAVRQDLYAVLIGTDLSQAARDVVMLGAGKVYVIEHPLLKEYQTDAYTATLEKVIRHLNPRCLVMGQTSVGRDMAPMLAFRLDTTAVLDCVALEMDPATGQILQTKPVYGGNALATFSSVSCPQIVTIRDKAMPGAEPDSARQGEIISYEAGIDESVIRAKLVQKIREDEEGVRLEDAAIIISGGRGIGGAEGFEQLKEIAALVKGAVGASRPACDNGWIATNRQVGITGKIVSPDLYIAVGLSGSIQHLSGCSQSKNIIAVNKDREAPIFNYADFGVVGDWKKVMPAFKDKLQELLNT